jgi:aminocarboxymuconate-semialdehyde decarboxylase
MLRPRLCVAIPLEGDPRRSRGSGIVEHALLAETVGADPIDEERCKTMKIDIWTHVLSPTYVDYLERAGRHGRASFFLAQRAMHDIDFRLSVIDEYDDYCQILTPMPAPLVFDDDALNSPALVETVRRNNEELAEIAARHPDRFAGHVAATAITDPDAATEEAIRCVRDLGALGVQLEADAANFPLHEDRYEPLFASMEELGAAVWLHPCRTPGRPGFAPGTGSFLLFVVFGWTFDTTITISQLIFAGIYDRHPDLKLIAHHGGGLIPHYSGRVEMMPRLAGLDPSGSLLRALDRLERKPSDYFGMLYVDTAMFGGEHGLSCVADFFGPDRVLFGTDTPFDAQAGAYFIPRTIADVNGATDSAADRDAIFEGNARRVLGIKQADGARADRAA